VVTLGLILLLALLPFVLGALAAYLILRMSLGLVRAIFARDGAREENLVWKDTVLVRTGETVDMLRDVTNPGIWMAHCHIAEHHESE
jgi:FtsP/CotA-like multicopper oxidase with cupredoxin domain